MKLVMWLILALMPGLLRAEALRDDAHVTKMLVAAQVGDILRTGCPQVSARMFVVLAEMAALRNHALAQGHGEKTIRTFLKDRDEKQRIRALADDYLAKAGLQPKNTASFCAVARAEVAAGTTAGHLIRVRP